MIKLNKEQNEYILSILSYDLKDRVMECVSLVNGNYEYNFDDDLEIEFNDFLQDKQVEVGYDEHYNPNDEWEKIQKLIDLIDNQ